MVQKPVAVANVFELAQGMAGYDYRRARLLHEVDDSALEYQTRERVQTVKCFVQKQIFRLHRQRQRNEYLTFHSLGKVAYRRFRVELEFLQIF